MTDPEHFHEPGSAIMVADADPFVRELTGQFLIEAGYEVQFAHDGYEALDKVRKSRPLVLMVDIIIPKLDGLALCRLIKSDPVTDNVRVIIFSVLSSQARAQKAGADAFLLKPLEKARLYETITSMMKQRGTLCYD